MFTKVDYDHLNTSASFRNRRSHTTSKQPKRMKLNKTAKINGFSLVDLMVVITVIGVVAAILAAVMQGISFRESGIDRALREDREQKEARALKIQLEGEREREIAKDAPGMRPSRPGEVLDLADPKSPDLPPARGKK